MIKKEQKTDNTMVFTVDYPNVKQIPILALTDVHYDSKYCDRKKLKAHLDEMIRRDGYCFFNGDLFDVMGCYKDPRSKSEDVRPEYISSSTSYLDAVITDVYEFLKPYADRILFIGYGNHETAILKHRDTDPINRLIHLLNQGGHNILKSMYYGVARFRFQRNGRSMNDIYLVHHHGYGGNAKRSKGVLNVDLNSQRFPFADIYFSGHIHQKWQVPVTQEQINQVDELSTKEQIHICGGCYKGLDKPKNMGWAVEKGMSPSVTGGWFITLNINRIHGGEVKYWIDVEDTH